MKRRATVKADEMAALWPKVTPPLQCKMLNIVHLLRTWPCLLTFDHRGMTAKEFRSAFEKSWGNGSFKAAT